jgi:penicillin-binding protein 1B
MFHLATLPRLPRLPGADGPRAPRDRLRRAAKLLLLAGAAAVAIVAFEAGARARLEGPAARAPTQLYARPVVLSPGERVDRERLARSLERTGYRRAQSRRVRAGEYRLDDDRWTIGRRPFRLMDPRDPGGVAVVHVAWGNRVVGIDDERGAPLAEVALEPEPIGFASDALHETREPVPLSALPPHLVDAVLAVEDRRFYSHAGLDLRRIVGALIANLRAGRVSEGASTITQQLAKNLYLDHRRTPIRKLREAALALAIEARYDKRRILEAYFNEIYLGQDGAAGIRGVGRAAQYYFGKDVRNLSLAESALLAGMIRAPNLYHPIRHRTEARERRALVLRRMAAQGRIDEDAARRADRADLPRRVHPLGVPPARHFRDFILARVTEEQGRGPAPRGMAIVTTLDATLQRAAERAVREGLSWLGRERDLQAALVALDPRSGEVLAMVGGRDYGASQFNRAAVARRQPGSAFKPVVALAALRRPEDGGDPTFTLASELDDEPLAVETPQGLWEPANYDGGFRGRVTFRVALEQSLNVPFARVGLAIGPRRVVETARALGIESPLRAVPSIALGSSEVTPLEMTRAYGVLAAGGLLAPLRTTLAVVDAGGLTARAPEVPRRMVSPGEAYLVTSALEGAVARGTGRGLRGMGYEGPIAAKSGTSSKWRDAWFIAYTPALVVGVWVGYDDGRSMRMTGSRAALPIVGRFLLAALGEDGGAGFPIPDDVEFAERGLWGCWGETEVFLEGTAPDFTCEPDDNRYRWLGDLGERLGMLAERRGEELRAEIEALAQRLRREFGVRIEIR